jgi:hypothetical protein
MPLNSVNQTTLAGIERQLKRIADALERANPQRDTTFVDPQVRRLLEIDPTPEGDWILDPKADHTGEETD